MFNFSRYQLVCSGLIVGLAFFGTLSMAVKSGVFSKERPRIVFSEPTASPRMPMTAPVQQHTDASGQMLCVHVAGKVKSPGIYYLKPGSRVNDAIRAAGGSVGKADLDDINLAQKINDGDQVYVAPQGKIQSPERSGVQGTTHASTVARGAARGETGERRSQQKLTVPGKGTVNINSASLQDLQKLPGIGPAMAQRVIDYRTENGRFKSVDELQEVRGIGPAKLERLRLFVSL